jgi:cytidine deaminase
MNQISYHVLDSLSKQALDEAEEAMEKAYNPYSRFYVGAALFTNDGTIISGSNVENAALGPTICAERAAVVRANAMGVRSFKGIAVIARGEDFDTTEVTAPCGVCRQVLYETSQISEADLVVVLSTTRKDKIIVTTIKELLPLAFGPADLGLNVRNHQK